MIINMIGGQLEDANNVEYPIALPSSDNKGYKESYINAIAAAIDAGELTVAEMPEAISNLKNCGWISNHVIIGTAEYTEVGWT